MAEWSNAPDSKSGVQVLLYRGFESLSFRQFIQAQITQFLNFTVSKNIRRLIQKARTNKVE